MQSCKSSETVVISGEVGCCARLSGGYVGVFVFNMMCLELSRMF